MAARRQRAGAPGGPLRLYVDTSVFGGVHDEEFRAPSERFFAAVRGGAFTLLVSEALVVEIASAPAVVQATFEAHRAHMEALETTAEATALADAYLTAKVVPAASRVDALHVALASTAGADAVVSWNFKHLVQLRRIRGFHAVNVLRGYPLIEIRSPLEVIDDEEA
jgi:predicted nucleic acid-binding protein